MLNADAASGGWVQVELVDAASGAALPGFSRAESHPLVGNSIAHEVVWESSGTDVSGLAGRAVCMRLWLRDAKLFSFQFAP